MAILISIQPQWVEKILNGEKTIEIRKTAPSCKLPCKVYIYCTKPKKWWKFSSWGYTSDELLHKIKNKFKMCDGFEFWAEEVDCEIVNGKVVAEFTLNEVEEIKEHQIYNAKVMRENACLSIQQLSDYTKGKRFYAWHIDSLKIYDTPKKLSEFYTKVKCDSCIVSGYESSACCYDEDCKVPKQLKKPPQSWCYLEELC